jgi:hypothetical protein
MCRQNKRWIKLTREHWHLKRFTGYEKSKVCESVTALMGFISKIWTTTGGRFNMSREPFRIFSKQGISSHDIHAEDHAESHE